MIKLIFRFVVIILLALLIIATGCSNDDMPDSTATPVTNQPEIQQASNDEQINKPEDKTQEVKPQQGYSAPNFTFFNGQGEEITLADLKGKPIFINFWASW